MVGNPLALLCNKIDLQTFVLRRRYSDFLSLKMLCWNKGCDLSILHCLVNLRSYAQLLAALRMEQMFKKIISLILFVVYSWVLLKLHLIVFSNTILIHTYPWNISRRRSFSKLCWIAYFIIYFPDGGYRIVRYITHYFANACNCLDLSHFAFLSKLTTSLLRRTLRRSVIRCSRISLCPIS